MRLGYSTVLHPDGRRYADTMISELSRWYIEPHADLIVQAGVRVDDFCVIVANHELLLWRGVHIGAHCTLHAGAGLSIDRGCAISAGCHIYTVSDDFRRSPLFGPAMPEAFREIDAAPVTIEEHCVIGAGTVILPGAHIGRHTAVGAGSVVKGYLPPFCIFAGAVAEPIGRRNEAACIAAAAKWERQNAGAG